MKKLIAVFLLIAFLLIGVGCTAEFYKHDTVYATNDHMTFSWWGYKNPDAADLQDSVDQSWWGKEILYIPAE